MPRVAVGCLLAIFGTVQSFPTCMYSSSDVDSTHYENVSGCSHGTGYGWSEDCPNPEVSPNTYVVVTTCSYYSIDCHTPVDYFVSDGVPEDEVCDPVYGETICDYNTWSSTDGYTYCLYQ